MPGVSVRRNLNGHGKEAEGGARHVQTVGLDIEPVAPAADALRQREAGRDRVAEEQRGQLPFPGKDQQDDEPGDDAAVDGDTALPDAEHGKDVIPELRPGENDVIDPGADDAERQKPEGQVDEGILRKAGAALLPAGEENRQDDAGDDQHAVPGNRVYQIS